MVYITEQLSVAPPQLNVPAHLRSLRQARLNSQKVPTPVAHLASKHNADFWIAEHITNSPKMHVREGSVLTDIMRQLSQYAKRRGK